eukprot:12852479-Heterocapsa_arctica.AAC.1
MDLQDAVLRMWTVLVDGQYCHLKPLLIIGQKVTNQPIMLRRQGGISLVFDAMSRTCMVVAHPASSTPVAG